MMATEGTNSPKTCQLGYVRCMYGEPTKAEPLIVEDPAYFKGAANLRSPTGGCA
jgi:hypothetical protein